LLLYRPILVPVFANQKQAEEDFAFMKKPLTTNVGNSKFGKQGLLVLCFSKSVQQGNENNMVLYVKRFQFVASDFFPPKNWPINDRIN